jgi:hypothetical protein
MFSKINGISIRKIITQDFSKLSVSDLNKINDSYIKKML